MSSSEKRWRSNVVWVIGDICFLYPIAGGVLTTTVRIME